MKAKLISDILGLTPGWDAQQDAAGLDAATLTQIVDEAVKFADNRMAPIGALADEVGCRIEDGRVKTPEGYRALHRQLGEDGWICADLSEAYGGMDLPFAVQAAAVLPMDGAAQPFMMASGASRAGAHCLAATAPDLAAEWCPQVAAGEWTLTICISEPDAGSDVGRIRTKATLDAGTYRIDGTKCWISFGDHDIADRIGHLCLARTGLPEDGTRGLSLFLVPNTRDSDGAPNGVFIERIEEKLGLHGSPTCVLRFESAEATLIGQEGRGLVQLFEMIELMRLQVCGQGAGIALEAACLARAYAEDRKQGGHPAKPPVPILVHPDVQRQLTVLDAHAGLTTAMLFEIAVVLHQARQGDAESAALASFLLPLAKNFGGELGIESASLAIQVLGGAGYTREWHAERLLRDARITTIYEGTTGMQGQDFLLRRLVRDQGAGLTQFLARARGQLDDSAEAAQAAAVLDRFETLSQRLAQQNMDALMPVTDAYLRAGWTAVSAVLAHRLLPLGGDMAHAARWWLVTSDARMLMAETGVEWGLSG